MFFGLQSRVGGGGLKLIQGQHKKVMCFGVTKKQEGKRKRDNTQAREEAQKTKKKKEKEGEERKKKQHPKKKKDKNFLQSQHQNILGLTTQTQKVLCFGVSKTCLTGPGQILKLKSLRWYVMVALLSTIL